MHDTELMVASVFPKKTICDMHRESCTDLWKNVLNHELIYSGKISRHLNLMHFTPNMQSCFVNIICSQYYMEVTIRNQ